jgi:predicted DNA-binding transcriptional regulator AlpA
MDEFMTTEEVAGVVRRSPETIRWFRHVGKGPRSFKIGRRVLYSRVDVEQWIAEAREGVGS